MIFLEFFAKLFVDTFNFARKKSCEKFPFSLMLCQLFLNIKNIFKIKEKIIVHW